MSQDKNDIYWFGTERSGVFRYDARLNGPTGLIQFTLKDGLCSNQIRTIQEDKSGNIWFCTGLGISRFDGKTFTTFPDKKIMPLDSGSGKVWETPPDDLWFETEAGVYCYNGKSFTFLRLPETNFVSEYAKGSNVLSPYTIYCSLKDKKGNLWFGTQILGVCHYDANPDNKSGQGKAFTWVTGKGLNGPAIRALFEDKNGIMWFGNNGSGLFRYDASGNDKAGQGAALTNITAEKGLGNATFLKTGKVTDSPGTLARVWTINEDDNGNIWVGTIDAGVWRYDGQTLTNYTRNDGLPSNVIYTIYKDKKGELLFGSGGAGVYRFNGKSFARFVF